jgi:hypothetical protein
MKDIILIFVVILVLLTMVSVLGGSVQPKMLFSSSPGRPPMTRSPGLAPGRSPAGHARPPAMYALAHAPAHPMPRMSPSPAMPPHAAMNDCSYGQHVHHHANFERFVEDETYAYKPVEYEVVNNEEHNAHPDAEEGRDDDEDNTNGASLTDLIEQHATDLNTVAIDTDGVERFAEEENDNQYMYQDEEQEEEQEVQYPEEVLEQFEAHTKHPPHLEEYHPSEAWEDGDGVEPFEGGMFAQYGNH